VDCGFCSSGAVALALLRAWFIIFICGKVFLHKRILLGCIDRRIAHMILYFALSFITCGVEERTTDLIKVVCNRIDSRWCLH
jgi:hypothetical protein